MTIHFMEPLNRAWERMKLALFKPFDLHKWMVFGFSAFLAGLMDVHNGSSGSRSGRDLTFREFLDFPQNGWTWLMDHPGWAIAILFAAVVLIVLIVALTWVSSRGVFMFIDNVVRNKAEAARPWKEYHREGDSLFLWRLAYGFIALVVFGALGVYFFTRASYLYDRGLGGHVPVAFFLGTGLLALILAVLMAYVSLFLASFVAPLQYKNRISAAKAWVIFFSLFGQYPLHFLGFGLIVFLLMVAFVGLVVVAGLVTCCIGFFLLIIPYVGTVVTLPFWYTLRAYSLEFLAQFGPEHNLFPDKEPGAVPEAPAPAATTA
ncbi:MAG: hypothetical protein R6X21_10325 [Candidatus Aminicenantes bacterium]